MIKNYSLVLLFLLLVHFGLAQTPVINSFSPAFGPVGSTVVITGPGFNASPAGNSTAVWQMAATAILIY